jgi:hypothetical protein
VIKVSVISIDVIMGVIIMCRSLLKYNADCDDGS